MVWLIALFIIVFVLLIKFFIVDKDLFSAFFSALPVFFVGLCVCFALNAIALFSIHFPENSYKYLKSNSIHTKTETLASLNNKSQDSNCFLRETRNDDGQIFYEYIIQKGNEEKSKTIQSSGDVVIIKNSNTEAKLLTKTEKMGPNAKYLFWCLFKCDCEETTYIFTVPENSIEYV